MAADKIGPVRTHADNAYSTLLLAETVGPAAAYPPARTRGRVHAAEVCVARDGGRH